MGWDQWDGMGLGQKLLGWEGLGQKKIFFHGMGWDWDTNSKKMWDGMGRVPSHLHPWSKESVTSN